MSSFGKSSNQTFGNLPKPKRIHNCQHRGHHKQAVEAQGEDFFYLKQKKKKKRETQCAKHFNFFLFFHKAGTKASPQLCGTGFKIDQAINKFKLLGDKTWD